MEQQSCYLPEGRFLETPQNAAAIGSEAGLREAIATGRRLEARVRVCDGAHNLHVELPCMRGLIPRAEGALGISEGTIMDVVELDAASNNGVDNVRALREEAVFSPAAVKKRVYIIDEVHMLSTPAFNALLKILEEPPAHLMFILATTELQKVPATILSRCQRHSFRRIDTPRIAAYLEKIAEAEHFDLSHDAAELIARLADGGVRVLIYSMDGTTLPAGQTTLLRDLPASAILDDVRLSDAEGLRLGAAISGEATGVTDSSLVTGNSLQIYDLQGRRVNELATGQMPRVYIVKTKHGQFKIRR